MGGGGGGGSVNEQSVVATGTNCSGTQSKLNADPCPDKEPLAVADEDLGPLRPEDDKCEALTAMGVIILALFGVGGVVVVMYGLSSCGPMSGTFCAASDHGGLGFHCSMNSVASIRGVVCNLDTNFVRGRP